MSDLLRSMQKRPGGDMPPPASIPKSRRGDYNPVSWDNYFDENRRIDVPGRGTFNVYLAGSEGPVVLLLHGGGFSGLSWGPMARELADHVRCRVVAPDLRGHGSTSTASDYQLDTETQCRDIGALVEAMYPDDPPPVLFAGHSMGGAIAVQAASRNVAPSLCGLVVIDVVEGTALESLSHMHTVIANRPRMFKSLPFAIEWSVRSGMVRNVASARVSMPGQLRPVCPADFDKPDIAPISRSVGGAIAEADEAAEPENCPQGPALGAPPAVDDADRPPSIGIPADKHGYYTWQVDLSRTGPYWEDWFVGISRLFLAAPIAKMLMLAGTDRLDRDLTIGQMQGKFQLEILPLVGHVIHEDAPDKVAACLAEFLVRNKLADRKLASL